MQISLDVISWRDKLHSVRITSIHSILVVDPPLMMAQSRAESTRDTCNYGQYINQFPQNTIKVIREFEWIQKKICRHKMSIMFNEICINEEMLPKYTYFKLHDPAAHKYNSTLEYRRDLVKRQITLCKNNIHSLNLGSRSSPDDGPKSGRKY